MFGAGGGTSSYQEVEDTDLIVLWGSNARETHPIFFHHVLKAVRKGARLYAVDPRHTSSAEWADVWLGAIVTSLLFNLGKFGLALYLTKGGIASSYGAAGSFAALLVWIYYSSMILFFGAEFTKVYAKSRADAEHRPYPPPTKEARPWHRPHGFPGTARSAGGR